MGTRGGVRSITEDDLRVLMRGFVRSPTSKMLTGTDIALLRALADYAGPDGCCWPSQADLVEQTRFSRRAIRYALRALEQAGVLATTERPGTTPLYTLFPQVKSGGAASRAGGHQVPGGAAPRAGGAAPRAPGSTNEVPVTTNPPTPLRGASKITKVNGTPAGFDEWWEAYPRRVAKGAAVKAYEKALRSTNPATLLGGARRYAEGRRGEDQRFTKHPATWLNQQCWSDEPDKPTEVDYDTWRQESMTRWMKQ